MQNSHQTTGKLANCYVNIERSEMRLEKVPARSENVHWEVVVVVVVVVPVYPKAIELSNLGSPMPF